MHGGRFLEYAKSGKSFIDFSASINPYGLDQKLKKILIDSISLSEHYPNEDYSEIKDVISKKHSVNRDNIYIGNGANSIIFRLFQVFKNSINICIPVPSFESYRLAAESVDADITYYHMKDLCIHGDIIDILAGNIDVLVLANPNNPTGFIVEEELLYKIIEYCKMKNIFILLDECFLDFVKTGEQYSLCGKLNTFDNMAILKSLTKLYAFPGLRFGYLLTYNCDIMYGLKKLTPSWEINALALEAAGYSLKQNMDSVIEEIQKEKSILSDNLENSGIVTFPSKVNFLLCKYKKNLSKELLEYGIIVRDCSDFIGLNESYFRVAVRTNPENNLLVDTIQKIIRG